MLRKFVSKVRPSRGVVDAENVRLKKAPKKPKRPPKPAKMHKLPPAYRLFIQACKVPMQHWEIFGGILLIYGIINALLIGGLVGAEELAVFKQSLGDVFRGQVGQLGTGITLFGFLLTNRANTAATGAAGAYSTVLLIITSLAIIWGLRQVYAGNIVRIRDTFYHGASQIVPSLLVVFIVGLQLLPAALGAQAFSMLVDGNVLFGAVEVGIAVVLLVILLGLSAYMLCASLFALYIVTLPDMTPFEALRSAKEIVRYRRVKVILKLLALPVALSLAASLVMVPIAIWLTPIAPAVFYVLTILGLVVMHSYMYALYRELITDVTD